MLISRSTTLTTEVQWPLGFINIKKFLGLLSTREAKDNTHKIWQVSILCDRLHIQENEAACKSVVESLLLFKL